jgi:hypothetical protein
LRDAHSPCEMPHLPSVGAASPSGDAASPREISKILDMWHYSEADSSLFWRSRMNRCSRERTFTWSKNLRILVKSEKKLTGLAQPLIDEWVVMINKWSYTWGASYIVLGGHNFVRHAAAPETRNKLTYECNLRVNSQLSIGGRQTRILC